MFSPCHLQQARPWLTYRLSPSEWLCLSELLHILTVNWATPFRFLWFSKPPHPCPGIPYPWSAGTSFFSFSEESPYLFPLWLVLHFSCSFPFKWIILCLLWMKQERRNANNNKIVTFLKHIRKWSLQDNQVVKTKERWSLLRENKTYHWIICGRRAKLSVLVSCLLWNKAPKYWEGRDRKLSSPEHRWRPIAGGIRVKK